MKRPYLRALLASAAVAAAIALAGCNPSDIPTNGRAQAPLSEKMLSLIAEKQMDKESPILARIFKEEAELEVWKKDRDGNFTLLKTYPICRWSGDLGPKKKEGDRQAPEGFYTITPGQMNPASNYYLAFNTGFPNSYDRAMGYTGSELMVHGDCSSRGCYAMTDEQIQEIYALARESFFGGQTAFQLQAFPFRMTALNMAKHRNNPNFAFWKMLKEGHDHFEATRQEPKVAVCEKRYVFDAAQPENASKPFKFDAKGKCPVYRLDPSVAEAVLDKRRSEQFQMAEYTARNIATAPPRNGLDGGMNPVFASKLASHNAFDNDGRSYQLAGNSVAPGALPRTPAPPATRADEARQAQQPSAPVALASVPMPQSAPQPKEGVAPPEQPKSIAGLLGNLFSGPQAEAKPAAPAAAENTQVALRGSNTELAAKPKRLGVVRAAAAATVSTPKPREAAPAKPKAVADKPSEPAAKKTETPRVTQQAEKPDAPRAPERELRTAFSAPPAGSSGLLTGAQPVVPAGSFDSRFSGFR
ncbi:MAG: L,D-transpeptidase family protein [Rhizobiales bacterium]|nr:L,D-transpeptidase family protein [Hyphomicrobiales bacterium]